MSLGKNLGRYVIIICLMIIGSLLSCKVSFAEVLSEQINEEKVMIVPPRGGPEKVRTREHRTMRHSADESTGLFLHQNEEIEIILEEEPEDMELRVGQWGIYENVPFISSEGSSKDFSNGVLNLHKGSNRFKREDSGGMVYLINFSDNHPLKATIHGGVKVPYYIEGDTTPEEFERQLAAYQDVPFMEMANEEAIATIRIDRAKDIFLKHNQCKVFMDMMSQTILLSLDASGLSRDGEGLAQRSNQRIHLFNPTGGAGSLYATSYYIAIHSGTKGDREIFSTDGSTPDWGLSHEIGHTFQLSDYLWKNMTEVTVNIFSDYVQANWVPHGPGRYDQSQEKNGNRRSVAQYFDKLAKDPTWSFDRETLENSSYHFAVLGLYVTLPRVFGYDFYPILNQNYRTLPEKEIPKDDLGQKQLFIIMASKTAKRNLLPFFDYWRFTVTEETRQKIADMHLQPLEKEIWKDILATSEEEKAGTYRINDESIRYSVPQVNNEVVPVIPFEKSVEKADYLPLLPEGVSKPIPVKTEITDILGVDNSLKFGRQQVRVALKNDFGVNNVGNAPIDILPGDSFAMAGQNGVYAVLGYNARTKSLVARGLNVKILQNLPENVYPIITVYDQTMQQEKFSVQGQGKDYGTTIADALNGVKVEKGDIIKIYHKEAYKRVSRYKNNEKLKTDKETYYYRILNDKWTEVDDPMNKQTIEAKNTQIYVGETWTPRDNFVAATDENGNEVPFEQVDVVGKVDTDTASTYHVTYKNGDLEDEALITVLTRNDKSGSTSDATITLMKTDDLEMPELIDPATSSEKTEAKGSLTLDLVPKLNFGKISLGEANIPHYLAKEDVQAVQVTDRRGTGEGWNLQTSLSPFVEDNEDHSKAKVLKGATITMEVLSQSSSADNVSSAPTTKTLALDADSEIGGEVSTGDFITAAPDSGMGSWINYLSDGETESKTSLKFGDANSAGKYRADLTWILSNTP